MSGIKINKKVTIELTLNELKTILYKKFRDLPSVQGLDLTSITDTTRTETIQGADPHDAHYINYFDGVKITFG